MRRRIKCPTCGEKFKPTSADRYTSVRDYHGTGMVGALGSSTPAEYYDTFDCPACGRQIRVGERPPISSEIAEPEGDETEVAR